MIEIKFEINGREVTPESFGDALQAEALRMVSGSIMDAVGQLRCQDHHKSARITVKGKSVNQHEYEIEALL